MKRFPIVFAFVALALVLAPARGAERKPNIVLLVADDTGYNEFSMHGNKKFATPRIDSIGAGGVRFTDGYVSGTVCSPSRAGLLSGRYQQRFGHELNIPPAYSETNGLPLTETLLPAVLKDAGYKTVGIGKWHLGYAPKFHPMERGFTDFYGFLQGQRSYFPLEKPTRLNRMLRDREPVANESFTYMTDHLGEAAVQYIDKYKDSPFFMYLAYNATHGPYQAPKEDLAKVNGNKRRAMTLALDRSVGAVLDALDRHKLREDTLVFFIVDNGGATGHDNTPLRGKKGSTWEGGMRVPFLAQWPGKIPPNQISPQPVIALDIFATALAAAGLQKPAAKPLDGIDLLPLMTGQAKPASRTLYWKDGGKWAVRDGDIKLVAGNGGQAEGQPALYDLRKDIGETQDLAAERPEDVKRLHALYKEWAATHQPTPWGRKAVPDEDADEALPVSDSDRKK